MHFCFCRSLLTYRVPPVTTDSPASKRLRLAQRNDHDDVFDLNFAQLHKLFWGVQQSPYFVTLTTVIPDMRTLNVDGRQESDFEAIRLPEGTKFPHGGPNLLVTAIYRTFWDILSSDDQDWQECQRKPQPHAFPSHATVIKGQPGIGMDMVSFAI